VRAVRSVICQTYKDWELIVVDDKSAEQVSAGSILADFSPCISTQVLEKIRVFRLIDKGGKLIARNFGMSSAVGEWICWLDDDDEYSCRYLEYLNKATGEDSSAVLWNFGIVRYWRGGQTDMLPIYDFNEVEFRSGMIATGTFAFRRSCVDKVGLFPEAKNWTDFSRQSGIAHYNGEKDGKIRPMGNPWGDDFWYFRKLLEEYESKKLNAYLYYQHVGGGHNV